MSVNEWVNALCSIGDGNGDGSINDDYGDGGRMGQKRRKQKKNQPHYEGRAKKKENQSKLLVTMKNKTWSYSFIGRCWFTFFFLFIFILPLPLLYASHWVRASERARLCFLVYFFFIHVILSVFLLLFFPLFVHFFFLSLELLILPMVRTSTAWQSVSMCSVQVFVIWTDWNSNQFFGKKIAL